MHPSPAVDADTLTIRNIGDIYPAVGNGRYQVLIIIAGCIATIPIGMQEFMLVFLAFNPGWECEKGSKTCLYNDTILPDDVRYPDRCSMNRSDWRYLDTKGFSIVNEFGLICGMDFWIYTSSSVFYLGNVIGALVSGWLSDKIGRTRVMVCSYIMVLLTGLITSFLPNLWLFELIRILTGIFVPGTYMVMVVLSSEIVSEKYRPAASMVYWMFYSGGVALLGVKAFYLHSWRKLLVYGSVPYLITIILLSLLPESFVWLHVQGKEEELRLAIKKIAKINKKILPSNIAFKLPCKSRKGEEFSLLLLFRPISRLFMTMPMMFTWFAIGLIYFGESLAANDLTGNEYRDFVLLAVVDIPAAGLAIILAMKLGRKRTAVSNVLLCGLCISLVGLFPETKKAYKKYRLIFGITAKFFCSVSFDVMVTWCTELYPTKLRSNANGVFNSCLIFGGMCAPWLSGYLYQAHRSAPFFVMGSCMVISFIMLSHLKETKGKRLPQRTCTQVVHEFEPENVLDPHMELRMDSKAFHELENYKMQRTSTYIMHHLDQRFNISEPSCNSPNLHVHTSGTDLAAGGKQRARTRTVVYKFDHCNDLHRCDSSRNRYAYDNQLDSELGESLPQTITAETINELERDYRSEFGGESPNLQVHLSVTDSGSNEQQHQQLTKTEKYNQIEPDNGLQSSTTPQDQLAYENGIDSEIEKQDATKSGNTETITMLYRDDIQQVAETETILKQIECDNILDPCDATAYTQTCDDRITDTAE